MKDKILAYLLKQREKKGRPYITIVSKESGVSYNTVYSIVEGRRGIGGDSLEKLWKWYELKHQKKHRRVA